jgi:hypothetical protein
VVILAAPRSGSTLLFETLSKCDDLHTIGGESHGLFESIPRFNPALGRCDSNALFAADASPAIIHQIRLWFVQLLRDSRGRSVENLVRRTNFRPRLLEKTPKNALRVSLLNAIFPDALFIYLYRNPRENISSMMDAWESGRFVTYNSLPGRITSWSLLLPPGWRDYNNAPLEEIAAFQWKSANMMILQELLKLDRKRWIAVSYGQQTRQPVETIHRLCEFCEVSADSVLKFASTGHSRLSRYTLTPPADDKWHKNARALSEVLPKLNDTMDYIQKNAGELPIDEFDLSVDPSLMEGMSTDGADGDGGAALGMDNGN